MATRSAYDTVYSVDEVARIFRLTPRAVRALIRDGEIPAIRLGRYYRVPKPVVDAIFANSIKSSFTPSEAGFGARKKSKVDSVAQVNRMRERNKKSLKQAIAELDAWRA